MLRAAGGERLGDGSAIERLAHPAEQGLRLERLCDEVAVEVSIAVAGHLDHARPRIERAQPLHELRPAQPRHDRVRQDQIDLRALASNDRERLLPVPRGEDAVAGLLQEQLDQRSKRGLVLDDEDRFAAAAGRCARRFAGARWTRRLSRNGRNEHREGRSLPRLAVDDHCAAELLDEPVDDREPETRSRTLLLGGEERVEQTLPIVAGGSLTSCETPPASRPSASSRSAWCSRCSASRRAEMSSAWPSRWTTRRSAPRIAETANRTQTKWPSLCR